MGSGSAGHTREPCLTRPPQWLSRDWPWRRLLRQAILRPKGPRGGAMTMRQASMTMRLLLAGAPATAQDAPIWSSVQVPVVALPEARPASRPLSGRLALPAGAGPFPAMIVLHGCDGIVQRDRDWAVRLTGWGYAALVLDSFTPRGVGNICRATGSINRADR